MDMAISSSLSSSSSSSSSLLQRFLVAPSLLHPPYNIPSSSSAFTPNLHHSFCNPIPLPHHRYLLHRHRHSFYLAPLCKQQKQQKSQKDTSLPPSPPSTREEAISQARNAISLALEKSLRSSDGPSPVRRRKLQKPSRFQVELPLLEESDSARASLLLDLISSLSLGKTGNLLPSCTVFCNGNVFEMLNSTGNPNLALGGESDDSRTFQNPKFQFCNIASGIIDLQETQVVVIFSPNFSNIAAAENIVKASDLRPVLVINPDWYLEKEKGPINVSKSAAFIESFEVIYSYLPLVIQGFFSKTQGAVVKQYVENGGSSSSSSWFIYANEGDNMKCVSRLAKRPSAEDLKNALYNAVAANSPLTKSVKFLKGLLGDR